MKASKLDLLHDDRLESSTSLSLYRIAQELLHNVIKHSQAKNVQIELTSENGQICFRILDDGVGFNLSDEVAGLGLASMRQRVRTLAGAMHISSSPRAGTRIELRVPYRESGIF